MKKIFSPLKKFRQKTGKWFWLIIVILLVGVGIFISSGSKKNAQIVTTTVQKGMVKEELVLSGSVKADKHVILYFPAGGKINGVYVKEGDWVKKGQALVSVDRTILNSSYQQALNNYRNYQAAAENVLDSVKGNSADETYAEKATRTAAEVARDNAFDAVTAAQYNLRNATLYAPFAGLITSLPFPSPGVNVSFTDPQVEILDPESIYFEVEADQSEVINIKVKQIVQIVLDSYRDKLFSGTVTFVGYTPKPNEAGTIYKIKVELSGDGLDDILPRVGMSGDANFILSQKEDALFVPSEFVNSDKNGRFVNLGRANNKVRVTVGIEGEDQVEITSGVKEGDVLYD